MQPTLSTAAQRCAPSHSSNLQFGAASRKFRIFSCMRKSRGPGPFCLSPNFRHSASFSRSFEPLFLVIASFPGADLEEEILRVKWNSASNQRSFSNCGCMLRLVDSTSATITDGRSAFIESRFAPPSREEYHNISPYIQCQACIRLD